GLGGRGDDRQRNDRCLRLTDRHLPSHHPWRTRPRRGAGAGRITNGRLGTVAVGSARPRRLARGAGAVWSGATGRVPGSPAEGATATPNLSWPASAWSARLDPASRGSRRAGRSPAARRVSDRRSGPPRWPVTDVAVGRWPDFHPAGGDAIRKDRNNPTNSVITGFGKYLGDR